DHPTACRGAELAYLTSAPLAECGIKARATTNRHAITPSASTIPMVPIADAPRIQIAIDRQRSPTVHPLLGALVLSGNVLEVII
ncbi:MAG: hypothetical protein ACWGPR_12270, partial [Candidatus Deferrimicrobiaceae bacterium]